jgi:hypothetical protein
MPAATRSRPAQKRSEQWFAQTALELSADSYVQYLTERGYAAATVRAYFRSVAHFSHWFARQRADLAHLSEGLIDRFLDRHLPRCQCAPRCVHARVVLAACSIRAKQAMMAPNSDEYAVVLTHRRRCDESRGPDARGRQADATQAFDAVQAASGSRVAQAGGSTCARDGRHVPKR